MSRWETADSKQRLLKTVPDGCMQLFFVVCGCSFATSTGANRNRPSGQREFTTYAIASSAGTSTVPNETTKATTRADKYHLRVLGLMPSSLSISCSTMLPIHLNRTF
jgi:hypothetical protein